MRVLHIAKYYPPFHGGMESFLRDLAEQTGSMGVENYVLAHSESWGGAQPATKFGNVVVERVATFGRLLYAPVSPSFGRAFFRVLRDFDPEVLHIHMPNVSAFWVLALRRDVPVIVHWHSDVVFPEAKWLHRFAYGFYKELECRLLHRAVGIIVTSPDYLSASKPLLPFRSVCCVVPLGLNDERMPVPSGSMEIVRQRYAPVGHTLFLAVGRFAHYKGFSTLVEAASLLKARGVPARIVIVGDGEDHGVVERMILDKSLQGFVQLPGCLADDDLLCLYQAADVFCLPSFERTEAFGMVLLEAMAASTPLITNVLEGSGVNFVNEQGVSGIKIVNRTAETWAAAMEQLHRDSNLRKRLGQGARDRFKRFFRIDRVAEEVIGLYKKVKP